MANADEEVDEFFVFRLELKLQDVDEDENLHGSSMLR